MIRELLDAIIEKRFVDAKQVFLSVVENLIEEYVENLEEDLDITEANVTRIGRVKLIRARVRNGKIQRRVRVSAIPGYTIRGGKMIRMSSQEKRNRRLGQRRGKIKRRSKIRQAIRKRKISLRKRNSFGIH